MRGFGHSLVKEQRIVTSAGQRQTGWEGVLLLSVSDKYFIRSAHAEKVQAKPCM